MKVSTIIWNIYIVPNHGFWDHDVSSMADILALGRFAHHYTFEWKRTSWLEYAYGISLHKRA